MVAPTLHRASHREVQEELGFVGRFLEVVQRDLILTILPPHGPQGLPPHTDPAAALAVPCS